MLKRVSWRARSNWSAGISMTLARLLRVSRCFTMIQLLLLARWTKRPWHIGKLAKPRKQIGWPGSCTNDIPITPAVDTQIHEIQWRLSQLQPLAICALAHPASYTSVIASRQGRGIDKQLPTRG